VGTRFYRKFEGVFELGDLEVQRGGIIRDAKLAWQTGGPVGTDQRTGVGVKIVDTVGLRRPALPRELGRCGVIAVRC
jgi:hypothetical protein